MQQEEGDIEFDTEHLDDSVMAEEHMGDAVKKLRERLKEAKAQAKEYLDNWQRAQADFVNLRKRDEEAKADYLKFAEAGLIEELLPVLDGLTLAVQHGDKGVEQIRNLLLKTLRGRGLDELDPIGETFDPSQHEAVAAGKVEEESEDHKIIDVLQKGYILHGKVIRPAKVKVGEFSN